MDITALPTKEELLFSKKVFPWTIGYETISGKKRFIFEDDVPPEILELYQKIKPKLGFAY